MSEPSKVKLNRAPESRPDPARIVGYTLRMPRHARVALALLAVLLLGASAEAKPYRDGEKIRLTGLVTDAAGRPLPQVHVVLEASRSFFNVRRLGRDSKDPQRVIGLTNERGEYVLEWSWSDYYNAFELLVGVPIRKADGERLKVLERLDIRRKIGRGSPVVTAVVVQNASFIDNLRAFLATVQSEDQRRIHLEAGEPDKVDRVEYGDRVEVAWWYFAAGRVYRFTDGRLAKVDSFAPIEGEREATLP